VADTIFSDLNLAFTAHPVTGALSRKLEREAVRQSVKSLVLTNRGERPFKPDIGCSIRSYLFELWTPMVKQQMEHAVLEVIRNYEPRARIIRLVINDNPDMNSLIVSIAFMIRNDPTPVTLDVILNRVR